MNGPMSITDKDFNGERMSFLQLIDKYCIVIPVIQRDYAQGRMDEHATEVRENFVRNLISYLRDPQKNSHDLDFVFGTVNDISFIPLDGQQRLTTLFLLHLYLAGRSGKFDAFMGKMKVDNTYKFSYKTRNSSTLFCERLLSENVFEQLVQSESKNPANESSLLSQTIQNQSWFYQSWLDDPTVAGMLVTLTEIDNQFLNLKKEYTWDEAYKRLFEVADGENQPITFQLLPLNGYSRTDDLYIKLNARGIHLSDFENFKARIEDLIEYDGMAIKNDFKNKVDVVWSEYLWKYRGSKDNTDAVMENLFRNFIAFSFRSKDKETMDYLLEQNKKTMRFTFTRYCELGVMHRRDEHDELIKTNPDRIDAEKKMIEKVMELFDVFCNDNTTPENFQCRWFDANAFITDRIISNEATYHQRLQLYSYLRYRSIHKENVNMDDLNQWMRLVRNLDDATDIDDSAKFSQSLDSIDDILKIIGTSKIQEWLSSNARTYKVAFFRSRQMKEECIKAELMKCESSYGLDYVKQAVEIGDTDDYFKGQMGFALEFAGAYDKYDTNQIILLTPNEIQDLGKNTKLYIERAKTIIEALKANNGNIISDRLLERALLSLGMYMRKNSANRLNFCNQLNNPYNSWKTLLFVEDENKYCRDIFKQMLDNISVNNFNNDLNSIITNHKTGTSIPKWRRMLIDNKNLIDYCSQGFVYMKDWNKSDDDDADVILLSQSQMNHYHSELWTKDLYNRYLWNNYPFKYGYHEQKRDNTNPTIFIAFEMQGEHYEFQLAHLNGKWNYRFSDKDGDDVSSKFSFAPFNLFDGTAILDDAIKFIYTN
ncbi:MAG: DUF262 domain-containing protein [Bacteroidales bacterium]|nr:DUF262 domain-containing protein [Bacteroidales bacterium]